MRLRLVVSVLIATSALAACSSGGGGTGTLNGTLASTRPMAVGTLPAPAKLAYQPQDPMAPFVADTSKPEIVIIGFGDSYGSGEGNPSGGTNDADAPERSTWWDAAAAGIGSTDARMCHRSSKSAFVQAMVKLQKKYPNTKIYWNFFACTGARISHIFHDNYDPRYDKDGDSQMLPMDGSSQKPQAEQARAWLETIPWQDPANKHVDAVYMSIGGNDIGNYDGSPEGLGRFITLCIEPGARDCSTKDSDIDQFNGANTFITNGSLASRYTGLNNDLKAWANTNKYAVGKVFLNQYPDLLHSDKNDPSGKKAICGNSDKSYNDPVGRMQGSWVHFSHPNDWQMAYDKLLVPLVGVQKSAAAANGWELVRFKDAAAEAAGKETFSEWTTHGICATDSWIHTNDTAEAYQGRDLDLTWPIDNTSFGAFHPNAKGWDDLAARAEYHLDPVIRKSAKWWADMNGVLASIGRPVSSPINQSVLAASTGHGVGTSTVASAVDLEVSWKNPVKKELAKRYGATMYLSYLIVKTSWNGPQTADGTQPFSLSTSYRLDKGFGGEGVAELMLDPTVVAVAAWPRMCVTIPAEACADKFGGGVLWSRTLGETAVEAITSPSNVTNKNGLPIPQVGWQAPGTYKMADIAMASNQKCTLQVGKVKCGTLTFDQQVYTTMSGAGSSSYKHACTTLTVPNCRSSAGADGVEYADAPQAGRLPAASVSSMPSSPPATTIVAPIVTKAPVLTTIAPGVTAKPVTTVKTATTVPKRP